MPRPPVRRALALAALAVGLVALRAEPAPADDPPRGPGLLVCYPHGAGTSESARPVMERLGAYLAARTGEPVQPAFFNELGPARAYLERERPRFAIVSLGLYVAWRDELGLELVAQAERDRATTERFHLVVPTGSPWRSLEDVKAAAASGRRPVVWSSHLADPRFVSAVVFGGALRVRADDAGDVRGVATGQPLRALRRMKAGEPFEDQPVDAVLLEDSAWGELQKLAGFRDALRAAFTSAPLPTPPVVALRGVEPEARARLAQALTGMHQGPDGRELLGTLQLTAFAAPDPPAYEAACAAYAREAP